MIPLLLSLFSAVYQVSPGESIQNALDMAVPGDTVLALPGVHTGTGQNLVSIDGSHNGVVLTGSVQDPSGVVLSGEGLSGGIIRVDGLGAGPVDTTMVISGICFSSGEAPQDEPFGGAVYSRHSSPVIQHCVFLDNQADNGGAIYSWKGAPVIRHSVFIGNTCQSAGGAVYLYGSEASISHCRFQDSHSWDDGGGIFAYNSSPFIFNCLFTGGYAHDDGAGIYCYALSNPEIAFCTFRNNQSLNTGSAVYFRVNSSPTVSHCVATGNQGPAFYIQDGGDPQFLYNCVWGNPDGNYGNLPDPTGTQGNISEDPLLTEDCFLWHIQAGQPGDSPCIDAGEAASSLWGLEFTWTRTDSVPDSAMVDLGFHHGPPGTYQSGPQEGGGPGFLLRPNPAWASFTLSWSSDCGWDALEIYDLSGRRVYGASVAGLLEMTVPVSALGGRGLYITRLSGNGECSTGRVIVAGP